MCECCSMESEEELFNNREFSRYSDAYIGFELWLDGENNLNVLACLERENIRPILSETKFAINYCPRCGRKLDDGE